MHKPFFRQPGGQFLVVVVVVLTGKLVELDDELEVAVEDEVVELVELVLELLELVLVDVKVVDVVHELVEVVVVERIVEVVEVVVDREEDELELVEEVLVEEVDAGINVVEVRHIMLDGSLTIVSVADIIRKQSVFEGTDTTPMHGFPHGAMNGWFSGNHNAHGLAHASVS